MQDLKPILLLEDDEIDAMAVKRALKKLNIANPLIDYTDGCEALEYLRDEKKNKPSLILVDVNLPKMSGIEFLDKLKEDARYKNISAFVFSGHDGADLAGQIEYPVAGFISKPFDLEEFEQKLQKSGLHRLLTFQVKT